MSKISKQMKKGILEILILNLMSIDDMYGYEIIQKLSKNSKNMFNLKEGTLYPILYRLEDSGLISSYWENQKEKRRVPRKYYKITNMGSEELSLMIKEFNDFMKIVSNMLGTDKN